MRLLASKQLGDRNYKFVRRVLTAARGGVVPDYASIMEINELLQEQALESYLLPTTNRVLGTQRNQVAAFDAMCRARPLKPPRRE